MNKYNTLALSALLALSLTMAGCTALTKTTGPAASPGASPPAPSIPAGAVASIEAAVTSVYARVNPSVVNIQVELPASVSDPAGGALGSGFVWDTEGNIVTNNHVVEDATRITVTFYDGTTVDARLVGRDANSDLAVVRVEPGEVTVGGIRLQPVPVADSSQVEVGQLAIAIGNPFGLQGTLTVGFVSGTGRLLPASENPVGPNYSIPDIIQTDAAINPGNSGGVLLDAEGRLIGVTSSIATTSGTSAGVGFAIPSAIVQQVVPALIEKGRYDHPYLGISITSLSPDLARAMGLPANQRGALVQDVTSGGPAENAGLQGSRDQVTIGGRQVGIGGDIIIAYNGQTVRGTDDLIAFLARTGEVGQTVTLTIIRNGRQTEAKVTVGVRPAP